MKLIVKDSKELDKAIKLLAPLARAKSNKPLPILQKIAITASNKVELMATDLKTTIKVGASDIFEVIEPGGVCIHPSILSGLKNDTLIAAESAEFAQVGKSNIVIGNIEDYPIFPDLANMKEAGEACIGKAIKRAIHAISNDDGGKYHINCLSLNFTKKKIEATDGYRATIIKNCLPYLPAYSPNDNIQSDQVLIDDKILISKPAAQILSGIKEPIRIAKDDSYCMFSWSKNIILTKIVQGTFPSIKKAMPEKFDFGITVETQQFINILKSAAKMVDTNKSILCEIAENIMKIAAGNPEKGEFVDQVSISNPAKAQCLFGLNLIFLMDALKETGKTAKIDFVAEPLTPIRFTGDDDNFLSLVMPIWVFNQFITLPSTDA